MWKLLYNGNFSKKDAELIQIIKSMQPLVRRKNTTTPWQLLQCWHTLVSHVLKENVPKTQRWEVNQNCCMTPSWAIYIYFCSSCNFLVASLQTFLTDQMENGNIIASHQPCFWELHTAICVYNIQLSLYFEGYQLLLSEISKYLL